MTGPMLRSSKRSDLLPARLFFRAIACAPRPVQRHILFAIKHGYLLPRKPTTFSEKIQWRILNDRRDLIAVGGDKLRMKEYAAAKAPGVHIPETIWTGPDVSVVHDVDWDCDWVLKPISGSGESFFGSGSMKSSRLSIRSLERWTHDAPEERGEWAYEVARRGYLLERRIPTPDGMPPNDLKFYVFAGRVRAIYWSSPRSLGETHRFYSPTWQALTMRRRDVPLAPVVEPPANLREMVRLAEKLGEAYDFIRVDLFGVEDKIYFGELTPYPAGGLRRFSPADADRELGSYWRLPDLAVR